MNSWETQDNHHLFQLLAGDWYGDNPEDRLEALRDDKKKRAEFFFEELEFKKSDTVLEIGSGIGYTSKEVASYVKQLHCCDISSSFLDYAKNECKDISNISFHKLTDSNILPFEELTFEVAYADAVFIHLNIYEIYAYFKEFTRVIKPNGLLWINVVDDSNVDMRKLREMANYYIEDRNSLNNLLCYNSVNVVERIASYFGFAIISKYYDVNVNMKFRKENL